MNLVILSAFIAVCSAAKLDRSYLPPPSAATAGGSSASLKTPLTRTTDQGSIDLPSGSYTNSFQGVVVEAAGPGTRASPDSNQSGLGGPRDSYGSINSKVGESAFRGSLAGFRAPVSGQQNFEAKQERPQAGKDRSSNVVSYSNDVSVNNYSYGFETDNGISVGENGIDNNGIQAQGVYSYQGDDGQVYKVTYTADEGGYRPQGNHLPTPPPIPKEILKSLEQNAKDEAAGLVDDGSYDAQKYNVEGDYTHHNGGNRYNGAQTQNVKRPESDAVASGTFINQNSQAFEKPTGQFVQSGANFNGLSTQFSSHTGSNFPGNNHNTQDKESSQTLNGSQGSLSTGFHSSGQASGTLTTQFGQTQGSFSSQFGSENSQQGTGHLEGQSSQTNQLASSPQFGTQTSFQLGSQSSQTGSQFGTQPTRPSFGQSSTSQGSNNQGTQFGIQSQGSFGQAQNANSPSIDSSGSKKPSFGGQFTSNIGSSASSNNNRFPNNSPNQFGAEYLPPFTTSNKPSYTNTAKTAEITQQGQNKDQSTLNSIPTVQIQGLSSASAFASTGQPGFGSQQDIPNNFQSQLTSKPNQFNYNSPTNQAVFNTFQSSSQSASNSIGTNPAISQSKPTALPNIELTTPLEPNEKPAFEQGSFFNSQSSSSTVGNFGSQPQKNQLGSQFGAQNNIGTSQQSTQTVVPSFPTSIPQRVPQISMTPTLPSSTPATFSSELGSISQTTFAQNQQQNGYYSTPKPSFSQGPDDSYYYNQPSKPFNTPGRPQGSRFPSSPSYQFNSGISQNNHLSNQQGSFNNFHSSPSFGSVKPTSPTQISQVQGISSNNYNNGITQAAASSFPSVSPTTLTQFGTASSGQFGSKPSFSQTSVSQSNKPFLPQHPTQTLPSKPATTFGQQTTSFTQSQTQFDPSSTNRPFSSENIDTQTASTLTQQYQGTIYEYNKPAVTLPPPAHTGSSSSQNVPTDSSSKPQIGQQSNTAETATATKPQFGSQQTQFNQNAFAPQTLQTTLNLGSKPHISKPFGNLPPLDPNFGQNTQTTFSQTSTQQGYQNNIRPSKPNTGAVTTSQFGQGSFQTYKPFGSPQLTSQYSQNTQATFGTQFSKQPSKPFGSSSTQFGQTVQSQGSYNAGMPNQQNTQRPQSNAQPFKPFGSTGSVHSFGTASTQGIPSKPQFTTQTQFTQQQSFGTTQFNSQPARGPEPTVSTQTSLPSIHGSPDTQKPHYGQNIGNQGNTQVFQDTFTSTKPQITGQFGQNINVAPIQPVSSKGEDSSSIAGTSQTSQYKPFSSSFQSDVKPQTQVSQAGSISSSVSGSQTGSSQENQPSGQSPCCQGSSGSTITAVNLSKPSQAFAQTQSQFSGVQGGQFTASSVAGKGEEFSGPRKPPRFDATGYHY